MCSRLVAICIQALWGIQDWSWYNRWTITLMFFFCWWKILNATVCMLSNFICWVFARERELCPHVNVNVSVNCVPMCSHSAPLMIFECELCAHANLKVNSMWMCGAIQSNSHTVADTNAFNCIWLVARGVLIRSERKILLAGLFWDKNNAGWWLIS
jgi:hypothetical protein